MRAGLLVASMLMLTAMFLPTKPLAEPEHTTESSHVAFQKLPETEEEGAQWYEERLMGFDYRPDKSCVVRVVFRRDLYENIHFYFYDDESLQLLMHLEMPSVGYLLEVRTVPDPHYPDLDLLLFYTAAQYPVGRLWRVDPERRRIQRLLEVTYLDPDYIATRQVVAEWIPAHYVLAEGDYDFGLMAKRLWRWNDKEGRFIPSWWRIAEQTYGHFHWIDQITDQFDKLGTPCNPPEPVPANKEARFAYHQLWLRKVRLDDSGAQYDVHLAYDTEEAFFSVFRSVGGKRRLLRCTRMDSFAYATRLEAVPDPANPRRSLIVVYTAGCWATICRVNPISLRPVTVMDGCWLDLSRIREGVVKEWKQALRLVKEAGWYAYPPAFRKPEAMAYRIWRWDGRKRQFVLASSWRLGKWSCANYRRFGFWE